MSAPYASVGALRDTIWVVVPVAAATVGAAGGYGAYRLLDGDVPPVLVIAATVTATLVSAIVAAVPWLVILATLRLLTDIAVSVTRAGNG